MASTKFHLLPVGAPFHYEGRAFTKNAPLTGIDENGAQRMIPRSAVVEVTRDESGPASAPDARRDRLLAAAEDYHRECLDLIRKLADAADAESARQTEQSLESARQAFLQRLENALGQER